MRWIVIAASLAGACKGKDAEPAPPIVASTGDAAQHVPTPLAPVFPPLPELSGKPPVKATAPHNPAQLERLSQLELPGFTRDLRSLDANALVVTQRTTTSPKFAATITITHCMDCLPMQLDRWTEKGEALRLLLPPELRERADSVFEVGATELAGAKLIFTYQLGYSLAKDEAGIIDGASTHSYALYYNDGLDQLRVVAESIEQPESRDELLRVAPRDHLERMARAVLDAYAQRWGT